MNRFEKAMKYLDGAEFDDDHRIKLISRALLGLTPAKVFMTLTEMSAGMAQAMGMSDERFLKACAEFFKQHQGAREKAERLVGDHGERPENR